MLPARPQAGSPDPAFPRRSMRVEIPHALPTKKPAIQPVGKPALRLKGRAIDPHFPPRAPCQLLATDLCLEDPSPDGILPP